MNRGVVVSLCDRTGNTVQPWIQNGYRAVTFDLQAPPKDRPGRTHYQQDILDLGSVYEILIKEDATRPYMTFAAPPCTDLASSGARWWQGKGIGATIEALSLVEACRRICEALRAPFFIENPIGALSKHWRPPDHCFDPCDFAGYAPDPSTDAYTKKTCFWIGGGMRFPKKKPVEPIMGSKMHRLSSSAQEDRSITPLGLSYAIYDANKPGAEALVDDLGRPL